LNKVYKLVRVLVFQLYELIHNVIKTKLLSVVVTNQLKKNLIQ
jgi:hypothetical protein